jgi:hypothetical protein
MPATVTPLSTPHEVLKEQTPSPQAVHEFAIDASGFNTDSSSSCSRITSNKLDVDVRSDVVSDLISDQLVTQYVSSADNVGLPTLCDVGAPDSDEGSRDHAKQQATCSTGSSRSSLENGAATISSESQDPWSTSTSSATTSNNNIILGPERLITFHTESLGIKLSRHTDGHVRVLSITPFRSSNYTNERIRDGCLNEGDLIRQVADVDLRKPIDANVWKLTVGLIKMAPRPLEMIVATEYTEVEDVNDAIGTIDDACPCEIKSVGRRCEVTGQTILPYCCDSPENGGKKRGMLESSATRQIVFYQESLGVKLQHTRDGYVVVHSVTASSFLVNDSNDKPSRSGELRPGDVVLEVGGVWDLYHPISINAWGVLVKFIKECRRPMRMVVADKTYLSLIASPGGSSSCEDDSVQSSEQLSPCSVDSSGLDMIEEEKDGVLDAENENTDTDELKLSD